MQIPKLQVKKIISEELEKLHSEDVHIDSLLEEFLSAYSLNEDYVSKDALIDLLEMIEEEEIPKAAIAQLFEFLPKGKFTEVLEEMKK